jgi:hypothetical protein
MTKFLVLRAPQRGDDGIRMMLGKRETVVVSEHDSAESAAAMMETFKTILPSHEYFVHRIEEEVGGQKSCGPLKT